MPICVFPERVISEHLYVHCGLTEFLVNNARRKFLPTPASPKIMSKNIHRKNLLHADLSYVHILYDFIVIKKVET